MIKCVDLKSVLIAFFVPLPSNTGKEGEAMRVFVKTL